VDGGQTSTIKWRIILSIPCGCGWRLPLLPAGVAAQVNSVRVWMAVGDQTPDGGESGQFSAGVDGGLVVQIFVATKMLAPWACGWRDLVRFDSFSDDVNSVGVWMAALSVSFPTPTPSQFRGRGVGGNRNTTCNAYALSIPWARGWRVCQDLQRGGLLVNSMGAGLAGQAWLSRVLSVGQFLEDVDGGIDPPSLRLAFETAPCGRGWRYSLRSGYSKASVNSVRVWMAGRPVYREKRRSTASPWRRGWRSL
jgi:hypothetical protein